LREFEWSFPTPEARTRWALASRTESAACSSYWQRNRVHDSIRGRLCAFIYDEGDAMRGLDDLRGNSSSQLTAPQFRLRRLEISEMYKYVQKWRNRGVCNFLAWSPRNSYIFYQTEQPRFFLKLIRVTVIPGFRIHCRELCSTTVLIRLCLL